MDSPNITDKPQTQAQSQDPNPKPAAVDAQNGDKNWGSFVMESSEPPPQPQPELTTKRSVHWSPELVTQSGSNNTSYASKGSGAYVGQSPALTGAFSIKDSMETVKSVFGRWRSAVGEATKKAEDLAGNTWQHCGYPSTSAQSSQSFIKQIQSC